MLYVYPLAAPRAPAFDWLSDAGWPQAVVVICDVLSPLGGSLDAAVRLFGLTEAERRLAEFLCSGGSLADFTEAHAVSTKTVRNQMRSILRTTGTSRHTGLMLLLLRTVPGAP